MRGPYITAKLYLKLNSVALQISPLGRCVHRLKNWKTLSRSLRSEKKIEHKCLYKSGRLFLRTKSEQGAARGRYNDVLNFDSSSAILKIEWREEGMAPTAHAQPFLSPVARRYGVFSPAPEPTRQNVGGLKFLSLIRALG